MAKRAPTVADLKHRVALCSQQDVVEEAASLVLVRKDVFHSWAAIWPKASSAFSPSGFVVKDPQDQQTHEIYIRYRPNFDITTSAWVYEERAKSPARWFRVIRITNVNEDSQWLCLRCKLYESSDNAPEPDPQSEGITVHTELPRGFGD